MSQNVTIICGTNRQDSMTAKIAEMYSRLFKEKGQPTQIIDLQDLPDSFISSALYDNAGKDETFNPIRKQMAASDKFVFIIPEYNGSFPGVLKTFIDGLKFPDTFMDKKATLVGISSGTQGGGLALSHFTDILNYCGCHVLALKPRLAEIERHFKDGEITHPKYRMFIEKQVRDFLDF